MVAPRSPVCLLFIITSALCEQHVSKIVPPLAERVDLSPTYQRRWNEALPAEDYYYSTTTSPKTTTAVDCSLTPSASICMMNEGSCGEVSEDGTKEASLWYVGVILSIISSILSNFGVNVQKYSFNIEGIKPTEEHRPYVMQPYWVIGLVMVIVGAAGDFTALGFAAQSLVTPVGGATMVANVFFAYFWLGEDLSLRDILSTLMIIGGILIITVFGNKEEACYNVQELMSMYMTPAFVAYAIVFIIVMIFVYALTALAERKRVEYGPSSMEYRRVWRKIHRFGNPCLSGMIGAQDVLFAKSVAELIKSSIKGENQFVYFETYLLFFLMCFTIFCQLHFLAKGLEKFDAVYIIPVFQCFFISGSIICGAVYFKEFDSFTTTQTVSFVIGMLVTILGVVVLSTREAGDVKRPIDRFRAAGRAMVYLRRYYYEQEQHGGVNLWTQCRGHAASSAVVPYSDDFGKCKLAADAKETRNSNPLAGDMCVQHSIATIVEKTGNLSQTGGKAAHDYNVPTDLGARSNCGSSSSDPSPRNNNNNKNKNNKNNKNKNNDNKDTNKDTNKDNNNNVPIRQTSHRALRTEKKTHRRSTGGTIIPYHLPKAITAGASSVMTAVFKGGVDARVYPSIAPISPLEGPRVDGVGMLMQMQEPLTLTPVVSSSSKISDDASSSEQSSSVPGRSLLVRKTSSEEEV